jgi:predicted metallopeptidase
MPKKEKDNSEKLILAPDLEEIAEKLIEKYPETLGHLSVDRISFFWDTESKPKNTLARCTKVSDLMKSTFGNTRDFVIVFYKQKFEDMTPAQLNITIFHELLHCGEDGDIIEHDVQDFVLIAATFGVLWSSDSLVRDPLKEDINIKNKPESYPTEEK